MRTHNFDEILKSFSKRRAPDTRNCSFVPTPLSHNMLLSQPFRTGRHNVQRFISSCRWVTENQRSVVRKPSITYSFTDSDFWKEQQNPGLHQASIPVTLVINMDPQSQLQACWNQKEFCHCSAESNKFQPIIFQIRPPKRQSAFKKPDCFYKLHCFPLSSFTMWKLGQHPSCQTAQHE